MVAVSAAAFFNTVLVEVLTTLYVSKYLQGFIIVDIGLENGDIVSSAQFFCDSFVCRGFVSHKTDYRVVLVTGNLFKKFPLCSVSLCNPHLVSIHRTHSQASRHSGDHVGRHLESIARLIEGTVEFFSLLWTILHSSPGSNDFIYVWTASDIRPSVLFCLSAGYVLRVWYLTHTELSMLPWGVRVVTSKS